MDRVSTIHRGWTNLILIFLTLIAGAGTVVTDIAPAGGIVRRIPTLPRLGPIQTVDQNDVGDPFILTVPPGMSPPTGVPYINRGPDAYQSAPWIPATAARARSEGWYVLFGTTDWQENVPTAISVDLTHWTQAPDALPVLPTWATPTISMTWAPAGLHTTAGWVLYFSTEETRSHLECIGAATSSTPAGPYTDRSKHPLLCQRSLGGSIDPAIVHAPNGSPYLTWKNDGNAVGRPDAIWSQQLTSDGLRLLGEPHKLVGADHAWEQGIIEAPAMIAATAGGYWLFYAAGDWDSNHYGTGLAHCTTIIGPCTDASTRPFLATTPPLISPGGLDSFTDQQRRPWVAFTALVLAPSTWHPGRYYYNRVLDIAPIDSR